MVIFFLAFPLFICRVVCVSLCLSLAVLWTVCPCFKIAASAKKGLKQIWWINQRCYLQPFIVDGDTDIRYLQRVRQNHAEPTGFFIDSSGSGSRAAHTQELLLIHFDGDTDVWYLRRINRWVAEPSDFFISRLWLLRSLFSLATAVEPL